MWLAAAVVRRVTKVAWFGTPLDPSLRPAPRRGTSFERCEDFPFYRMQYVLHSNEGNEDFPPGKEVETGADAEPSSCQLRVVDPIEDTSNCVHGMPLCMPSVAVAYKGDVVDDANHDPHAAALRSSHVAPRQGGGATTRVIGRD